MNSLDLTAAYLGSNPASALYFGATKLWPSEPPVPLVTSSYYGITFSQGTINGKITNENITFFASSSSPAFTRWASSTEYIIESAAFGLGTNVTTLTSVDDNYAYNLLGATYQSNSNLTSANLSHVRQMGQLVFANCTSLNYVNLPKLTTIGTFCFFGVGPNGTININSGITGSANWNTTNNLQRLQSQNWTINYVN